MSGYTIHPCPPADSRKSNRGPSAGPDNRARPDRRRPRGLRRRGTAALRSTRSHKRAGVGQGSLYRHFPDRTALAVAVFEENVTELEEYTAPDERTIDDLLDRVSAQAIGLDGLHRPDQCPSRRSRRSPLGARFREIVVRLVAREHAAGRIGDHVAVDDVTMATGMLATELARAAPADRAEVAERARRLFRAAFSPRPDRENPVRRREHRRRRGFRRGTGSRGQ